jgi:predicted dehydrogenase
MIGIGVVGAGYWGPKHIRNFHEIPNARVAMVADLSRQHLADIEEQYRDIYTTTDFGEMLRSTEVDAVVIATPVSTHGRLSRDALLAGKHVLVEKPLAASSVEAIELVALAAERALVLMAGHTFLYSPPVVMLRDMVEGGELGAVYYLHSQRLNLGLFQQDINVLWDLAPHDLSILIYVLGMDPIAIGARAGAHVRSGIEDVAYLDLLFPNNVTAAVHVSWLDPDKVRRLTLVGSKKMVVYDDVAPVEKIRIYDRGVNLPISSLDASDLSYRYGGISIPVVSGQEPLRLQGEHFLECIETGEIPRSDGVQGLRVVQALEAAGVSLARGGVKVQLPYLMDGDGLTLPRIADALDLAEATAARTSLRPVDAVVSRQ